MGEAYGYLRGKKPRAAPIRPAVQQPLKRDSFYSQPDSAGLIRRVKVVAGSDRSDPHQCAGKCAKQVPGGVFAPSSTGPIGTHFSRYVKPTERTRARHRRARTKGSATPNRHAIEASPSARLRQHLQASTNRRCPPPPQDRPQRSTPWVMIGLRNCAGTWFWRNRAGCAEPWGANRSSSTRFSRLYARQHTSAGDSPEHGPAAAAAR